MTRFKLREAASQLLDYTPDCAPLDRLAVLVPDQHTPSEISFWHRYGIDAL